MAEDGQLEREEQILDEIIQYYLKHREAVSARTLSKISRLDLSPTTIRNLMEDLSSGGFLTSEGVPRGRIPTQKAFTIYVTRLRPRASRAQPPTFVLEGKDGLATLREGLEQAGTIVAEQTGWVAVAYLPPRDRFPLDWVRLHNVPRKQVLVTIRTAFGDLWSKLVPSAAPFPEDLLDKVSQYINSNYRATPLERIRRDVMSGEPKEVLERMPSLGAAFRMLRRAFDWEDAPEGHQWGHDNLLRMAQGQDPERLMRFARVLEDPAFLLHALQNGRSVETGWVSIGTETGYRGLEDCSVVGHAFGLEGWQGHIGVLGPMGMNYGQALQLTTLAAGALSGLLADLKHEAGPKDD